PLRNLALAPALFHNGAFTRLEDAIRHHLNVAESARGYDPKAAGVPPDLANRLGPIEPVLARLDPLLHAPIQLRHSEIREPVALVRDGLVDVRAKRSKLCKIVPNGVPSGLPTLSFEQCPK